MRCMSFWSGKPLRVIVADGSKVRLEHEFLSTIEGNVEYHHFENLDIYGRLKFLINRVRTEYSMLCSDDEFFLSSSLESQIKFLEKSKSFISCMGQCLSFRHKNHSIYSAPVYSEFINYELIHQKPDERIGFHMQKYTPSQVFSVVRTDYWKIAFDLALNGPKFSFWASGEIIVEMALAYLGKSKVINTLGWLRSKENERIQGKGAHERHSSRFTTWWESAEMENERELFTQLFAEKMSAVDGRPISVIKEEAHEGLKCYYGFSKNYHAGRHWFNRPEPMEEPMMDLAEKLVASGVSVNLEELLEIKQIVMEFHSKPVAKAG